MDKIQELKMEYNSKIDNIKNLRDENKLEEIREELISLRNLEKNIETLEEVNKLEVANIITIKENKGADKMELKQYDNKVLVNLLRKRASAEEVELYNAYTGQKENELTKGGYLVPETQVNKLYEYKRTLTDLSKYVNVVNVTTPKGKMPLEVLANQKLHNLTEGEDIPTSEVNFGQTEWQTSDFGDLMRVTNQLLDDTSIDIMNHLKVRIGKKVVNTVNGKIIDILKTLTPIEATKTNGLEKLDEAIIKGLDPVFRYDGIILTNQTGRLYLENQIDKQGRPLLTDSYINPGVKEFRGLKLVEISDTVLTNDGNKAPFFIGDMKALITMFDLKSVELAVGEKFENYTTMLRAIVRFDIKKIDGEAMKFVKIATA